MASDTPGVRRFHGAAGADGGPRLLLFGDARNGRGLPSVEKINPHVTRRVLDGFRHGMQAILSARALELEISLSLSLKEGRLAQKFLMLLFWLSF